MVAEGSAVSPRGLHGSRMQMVPAHRLQLAITVITKPRNMQDKIPSFTNGEIFMCDIHGIDYRIACDECQRKYKIFSGMLKVIIEKREKEIEYEQS